MSKFKWPTRPAQCCMCDKRNGWLVKQYDNRTYRFCSNHCWRAFQRKRQQLYHERMP